MKRCQGCFVVAFTLTLQACAAGIMLRGNPSTPIPEGSRIAVMLLDHADPAISSMATGWLVLALRTNCRNLSLIDHETVTANMTDAGVFVPRRPNRPFLEQFSTVIEADYLLTGRVTKWQGGRQLLRRALSTEVAMSLVLYEIGTGELLWSASGEDTAGEGAAAQDPSFAATKLLDNMLKKLPTFCRAT